MGERGCRGIDLVVGLSFGRNKQESRVLHNGRAGRVKPKAGALQGTFGYGLYKIPSPYTKKTNKTKGGILGVMADQTHPCTARAGTHAQNLVKAAGTRKANRREGTAATFGKLENRWMNGNSLP